MKFKTLPGLRAFYPEECAMRNFIFSKWKESANAYTFLEYDAPTIEPLELFEEKSGSEIVNQLFNFTDKGGRAVALRPEMTPSLARLIGAKANSLRLPAKWYSIGEQFRYERPQKGRLRSFYQFNVDILGESGVGAEAELIACLIDSFKSVGLGSSDFKICLSDRTLWVLFLKTFGISDANMNAVLSIIDKAQRIDTEKLKKSLLEYLANNTDSFVDSLNQLIKIRNFEELSSFFNTLSPNDKFTYDLKSRLSDWRGLLNLIQSMGFDKYIEIDFSIVRGLAYYTGFVFEAFEVRAKGRALAGGGRYDYLIERLTGNQMCAVGFAMGDVTLIDLLRIKKKVPDSNFNPDLYLAFSDENLRSYALQDASVLRGSGFRIEYPLKLQSFSKMFKSLKQRNVNFVILYGTEEIKQGNVKFINLKTGEENIISRENSDFLNKLCKLM